MFVLDDGPLNPKHAGFSHYRTAERWFREGTYFYRPEKPAEIVPLNKEVLHPALHKWAERFSFYNNQRLMIERAIAGENVISTTPTGSGKSLGFMVPAFHKVLSDPTARVFVFYPLRALGHDQVDKWFSMAKEIGVNPEAVQRIDGSTLIGERPEKLRKARIVLATPDVIHSWFMSSLDTPEARNYLAGTKLKVIDEVHAYDGVFGTNMMYLLRRMDHIQSSLVKNYDPSIYRQYIGASGTLADASKSFKQLTGVDAVHISINENGAPQYRQNVFHAKGLHDGLSEFIANSVDVAKQQTIVFVDSRVKAEEYTVQIRNALREQISKGKTGVSVDHAVVPYKSGLRATDYDYLHKIINSGQARVVVATSALEAGIDVDFTFGINVGIPLSKTALLQRMGRVGRRAESSFVVSTGLDSINGYSLHDYILNAPIEAPRLYPSNTSLQLGAGLCLRDEVGRIAKVADGTHFHAGVSWPRGFMGSYARTASPWEHFTPHERTIIPPGRTYPQRHLPLRSLPSERFTLVQTLGRGNKSVIGNVGAETALREYAAGSIVRHMGHRYRVNGWKQSDNGFDVVMSPYEGPNATHVSLFQRIAASLTSKKIIDGVFKTPQISDPIADGFLAHMSMKVQLSVSSFIEFAKNKEGGYSYVYPYRYYDDHELEKAKTLSAQTGVDYGPKRYINYDTFGVVLRIPEQWFGVDARKDLGERIVNAYCEKNQISPTDVSYNHARTALFYGGGRRLDDNTLAIYERGGNQVGLLEKLPGQLRSLLITIVGNLTEAVDSKNLITSRDAELSLGRVNNLLRFVTSLKDSPPQDLDKLGATKDEVPVQLPDGYISVLGPNTLAKYARTKTILETVRILSPGLNAADGNPGYWVQTLDRKKYYSGGARWVTVRQTGMGVQALSKEQGQTEASVASRFLSAAHITADTRHTKLAMETKTGRLYQVGTNKETQQVEFHDYIISDVDARSRIARLTGHTYGGAHV